MSFRIRRSERFQRLTLRRSRKGEEAQVFVLPMSKHLLDNDVFLVLHLLLAFRFHLCKLLEGHLLIGQGCLQLLGGIACLRGMSLINNDCEVLPFRSLHLIEDDRELLKRRDDDLGTCVDGIAKVL